MDKRITENLKFSTVAKAIVEMWRAIFLGEIGVEFDGEEILTEDEATADIIADFIESLGFDYAKTGYYDPEEDARDGIHDDHTGKWYVSVD